MGSDRGSKRWNELGIFLSTLFAGRYVYARCVGKGGSSSMVSRALRLAKIRRHMILCMVV